MKRLLVVAVFGVAALAASACGGGDKAPSAATPATSGSHATPASGDSRAALDSGGESGIFDLLLSSGLSGGGIPSSVNSQAGDPALDQYVLQSGDLPDGYHIARTMNLSTPDGISDSGKVDVAMSLAESGTTGSPDGAMLVSMVMRFSDLQQLEKAFSQMNADAFKSQMAANAGDEWAGLFTDIHAIDTGDLGDRAAGVSMTMDLSSLFGSFAQAFGGDSKTPVALPTGVPASFSIDMYLFARGSYGAALMHVYSAGQDVDETGLAKVMDDRLAAAGG